MKGGPLMIPLAILLVIAIFVFFERYLAITKAAKMEDNFMNIIRDNIVSGNVSAAAKPGEEHSDGGRADHRQGYPAGWQRDSPRSNAVWKMSGSWSCTRWRRTWLFYRRSPIWGRCSGSWERSSGCSSCSTASPATGEYSISNIAGGIYVKMISSASGLIIGIIAYIGYRFLNSQIDKATHKMEAASADFIDILQEEAR